MRGWKMSYRREAVEEEIKNPCKVKTNQGPLPDLPQVHEECAGGLQTPIHSQSRRQPAEEASPLATQGGEDQEEAARVASHVLLLFFSSE